MSNTTALETLTNALTELMSAITTAVLEMEDAVTAIKNTGANAPADISAQLTTLANQVTSSMATLKGAAVDLSGVLPVSNTATPVTANTATVA